MSLRLRFTGILVAAALPGLAGIAKAQTVLVENSPFLPPGSEPGFAGQGNSAQFELAGASVTDKGAEVCIYDVKERRSHWIPVGGVDRGIQVLSYDAIRDRAELRIDGVTQSLEMRKAAEQPVSRASFPSQEAVNLAANNGLPTQATPAQIETARKQREARMFVTDLMEIGMQQRRAFEEAQRKKAEEGK
jgi:hypothetical protein